MTNNIRALLAAIGLFFIIMCIIHFALIFPKIALIVWSAVTIGILFYVFKLYFDREL